MMRRNRREIGRLRAVFSKKSPLPDSGKYRYTTSGWFVVRVRSKNALMVALRLMTALLDRRSYPPGRSAGPVFSLFGNGRAPDRFLSAHLQETLYGQAVVCR